MNTNTTTKSTTANNSTVRQDFKIISDWVFHDSQVLDLGCADGSLMKYLQNTKNVHGYGLEREACLLYTSPSPRDRG